MVLKFLRKKKNMKRIIWVLAILIIPAFVIWGAGSSDKKKSKGPNYAGKIYNKKISLDEYLNMWHVTRDYATRTFGNNIPSEFIDQLTWNRIILLEEAKRQKISVGDSEVVDKLVSFPVFQRDGAFDKKLYKSILGTSAKAFEEKIRDDLRITKLREKVISSVSINDEESKEEYKKKHEKIKASYVAVPFLDFEKDAHFEEKDLVNHYETNKEKFRKPEQINVNYIEVLLSSFDDQVYIEDDSVKRYFEEHVSEYKKPDSEEIPELDEEIKKDITKKLSLERKKSLAEELSYKALDTVIDKKNLESASQSFGLEIKETGFFNMQQEIPGIGWSYEFTKKGFELTKGEISNVLIKTGAGFYIIQLKEKKSSYIPDFEETRETVVESFTKDLSIKLAGKKSEKVYKSISVSKGKGLETIAGEIKKEIKTTDAITRDSYIPTLGPAREFVDKCASLNIGEIAPPIKMLEIWAIARLDEYQGIDEGKFTEEEADFKEDLLSGKKETEFNKWFAELKIRADFVNYITE